MVFNATFNNISAISWWSVLLVVENVVSGENHRPVASIKTYETSPTTVSTTVGTGTTAVKTYETSPTPVS
jgi:hypothetical protein